MENPKHNALPHEVEIQCKRILESIGQTRFDPYAFLEKYPRVPALIMISILKVIIADAPTLDNVWEYAEKIIHQAVRREVLGNGNQAENLKQPQDVQSLAAESLKGPTVLDPAESDEKSKVSSISLPKPEIPEFLFEEQSNPYSAQDEVTGESSPKPPRARSTPKDKMVPEKTEGYVKFHREQFGHWVSEQKPWNDGYAWTYLYARGNYEPAIVNFRGEYIKLERSQFVTSKIKLGAIFGWGKIRVNSFLKRLVSDNMILI